MQHPGGRWQVRVERAWWPGQRAAAGCDPAQAADRASLARLAPLSLVGIALLVGGAVLELRSFGGPRGIWSGSGWEGDPWVAVIWWAAAHLFFAGRAVRLAPRRVFIPGVPITLASMVTTGFTGALVLVVTSMALNAWKARRTFWRLVFNLGNLGYSVFAGIGTFRALGPAFGMTDAGLSLAGIVTMAAVTAAFYLTYTLVHQIYLYVRDGPTPIGVELDLFAGEPVDRRRAGAHGRAAPACMPRAIEWLGATTWLCAKQFGPSYYAFALMLLQMVDAAGIMGGLVFLAAIYVLWRQFYLQRALRETGALAATDPATGLLNRRRLRELVEGDWGASSVPLAVLFIDLDKFKQINDRFGHEAGDRVLTEFGEVLRASVRPSDFAGRWGGDEFVVLLPRTDEETAREIAERLTAEVRAHRFPEGIPVSCSTGVGLAPSRDHLRLVVAGADASMYRRKRAAAGA